jgi:disulfide bond formation protein DsbB
MQFADPFTTLLAVATVLGNVLTLLILLAFLFARGVFVRIMRLLGTHGVVFATLLSAGASVGSLVYSEVVGFPACILCWIQRAFMYPQMFILGIAWWRPYASAVPFAFALSLIGGTVALYNWIKDMLSVYAGYTAPCPAVSGLPSCDAIYILEYGYVTIAMLALNVFILLGVTLYAVMRKERFVEKLPS